jgi:pimeloyl-ACP methyl ester carboxylesterase
VARTRRRSTRRAPRDWVLPFLAGALSTGAGLLLARGLGRRALDPALLFSGVKPDGVPPVVIVPGVMGSGLLRPDGTRVWLNVRNAIGQYSLRLPLDVPVARARDDLAPGSLLGTQEMVPRLFGFTEYYDLITILETFGYRPATRADAHGLVHHVCAYDWRRDLVESARQLDATLDALADLRGDRDTRFNVVGHSMGGLVARYYLRYGTAEPRDGAPVTWAGAKRIANLVLVATPNAGGIHALEALVLGNRVGLSYTTLSNAVVARMPSVYQLLPPKGAPSLLGQDEEPVDSDLHDVETWRANQWGPFAPGAGARAFEVRDPDDKVSFSEFVPAALDRARAFHRALSVEPSTQCPTRVTVLGGDCLPTLARAVLPERPGLPPRFEAMRRGEVRGMFAAGDGRVTRQSVMGSHLPQSAGDDGAGYAEISQAVFGAADHHGIYSDPTFQSLLLRRLLRSAPAAPPAN